MLFSLLIFILCILFLFISYRFNREIVINYGPISSWASVCIALISIFFSYLSYKNSTRSLDLANTAYMAKVIENFANRANDAIEEVIKNKEYHKKEEFLFQFIYEVYKISNMIRENANQVKILHAYLSKNSINELENGLNMIVCYQEAYRYLSKIHKTSNSKIIRSELKVFYEKPIQEYDNVFKIFKKNNLTIKDKIKYVNDLRVEMQIM